MAIHAQAHRVFWGWVRVPRTPTGKLAGTFANWPGQEVGLVSRWLRQHVWVTSALSRPPQGLSAQLDCAGDGQKQWNQACLYSRPSLDMNNSPHL